MATVHLVYATAHYRYFMETLCRREFLRTGRIEQITFPDGELYHRLTEPVKERDVIVVGGTVDEAETLELYDLACGLVQHGANTLTLVVPYFGYSTMERALKPGEIVTGKTRALLLSSIPEARVCNEIVLVDLHTAGICHYFEGHIRSYHLYSKKLIGALICAMDDFSNVVLASTDAGRAKWIETLALEIGSPVAFAYKHRLSGTETQVRGLNANVKGRHVVIYDDMIRTGGSLIGAATAYKQAGASKITGVTTHGVFSGSALDRLRGCGLFERIVATDTHPRAVRLASEDRSGFLRIHSMIPDIAEFLVSREVHYGQFHDF